MTRHIILHKFNNDYGNQRDEEGHRIREDSLEIVFAPGVVLMGVLVG